MAIGVGNLVSSADYNAIVNTIHKVLGDDGSNEQVGYGRTPLSSTVSAGDVIDADLMDNLYSDLVRARTHQRGSSFSWDTPADGINAPDAGEYIGAFAADLGAGGTSADATADEAEGFLDFSQAAADIDADKYDVGSDQTSIEVIETSTRTSAWNGTITHTVDVVWANANERRYFFNSGGWVSFDAGLTGGNSVAGDQTQTYPNSPAYQKDEIWQTMLNTMGSIRFTRTATTSTGSGTGTSIGNYDLTSSYQTIFTKSGSGVYSENSYTVEARNEAGGNKVRFRIKFNDADVGDNRDADAGFPGEGTPVDENVTGTITSNVSTRAATGVLNISHPSGVQVSTLQGSLSTSYTLTSSATSADEGTTVSVTMTTTGVSNGTNVSYTVTGISAADLSSGSLTGNFNIQNNTATVSFGIANDATTEGTETMTITSGGQSLDIDISDTSQGAVYSLSPSATSINEGGTVTFTLNTENVASGSSFAYTITGIDAADLSSGSLTGTLTVTGTYASSTGSVDITLSNDGASEGEETITFSVAGLSTNVTVNDTSASSVSGWPTQPLANWGVRPVSGNTAVYSLIQSFAALNITNDFSNNRIKIVGYTWDNKSTAPTNTGYITYSGYSTPTIEVRFFQSNLAISHAQVGQEDYSYDPTSIPTGTPKTTGTWYTVANNATEQFFWIAGEFIVQGLGNNGSPGDSVSLVSADNVSFEIRISETNKPTVTRTSPTETISLSADLTSEDPN
jgi:hypothetical protein